MKHRSIVAATLLYKWEKLPENKKLAHGSHVLIEYGGAAEELFAFTYAIFKQCNAPTDTQVFFQHMFHYKHRELYEFIKNTDFKESFEQLLNLPSTEEMAARFSYAPDLYRKSIRHAEETLEDTKHNFFTQNFREVFNKLKHPFLVLAPLYRDDENKFILPILTESKNPKLVATVTPFELSFDHLLVFAKNIEIISQNIEFLVKLLLRKPWR